MMLIRPPILLFFGVLNILGPLQVSRPTPPAIAVSEFLGGLSTGQSGYHRYEPRTVTLLGERYEQALMTEVANARPGDQVATLSMVLNGEFDRFQVTVGREEREAARGLAYTYFEVWGDDRLLSKSDALGAAHSPGGVSVSADQPTRRNPQDLDVPVVGVKRLRLVTRYASDLPQRGRAMDRAKGCVWANPRLIPLAGYIGRHACDPLRDALRIASARLTAGVVGTLQTREPGLRLYPLAVGVAPLRRTADDGEAAPEPVVRAALLELLTGAHNNRQGVFRPVDRNGARLLTVTFPPNRPETDETAALVEVGRKAGSALVVTGSYSPGPDGKVALFLVDTRTGAKSPLSEVSIASLRPVETTAEK